jgi:lactate permease
LVGLALHSPAATPQQTPCSAHSKVAVGKLLGFPPLLLPTLNSVGAEVGKPVAPQTASVGVSTSRFVRNEGAVIRHNMAWTLILLIYLILIGVLFYLFFPRVMALD